MKLEDAESVEVFRFRALRSGQIEKGSKNVGGFYRFTLFSARLPHDHLVKPLVASDLRGLRRNELMMASVLLKGTQPFLKFGTAALKQ